MFVLFYEDYIYFFLSLRFISLSSFYEKKLVVFDKIVVKYVLGLVWMGYYIGSYDD